MADIIVPDAGIDRSTGRIYQKVRKDKDISFADRVTALKKQNKLWEVIETIMQEWAERSPEDFQGFKIQVGDHRRNLSDRRFAETKDGKDMNRRFIVAFPYHVQRMIRAVYSAEELPMDQSFFREFAKRYPAFQIPEKI